MRRLFSTIVGAVSSMLLFRWGFGIATPSADMRRVRRFLGWCERTSTRLDALAVRLNVIFTELIGLDQWRWRRLRWRFEAGDFSGDSA